MLDIHSKVEDLHMVYSYQLLLSCCLVLQKYSELIFYPRRDGKGCVSRRQNASILAECFSSLLNSLNSPGIFILFSVPREAFL